MERVLIIGGNGFIGKNVVDAMKDEYEIGIYDIHKSENTTIPSYEGDVIGDENFEQIVSQYDKIIYLISAIMPKQSMEEPFSSYTTDIPLLIHTLEICRKVGVKRIIYASSGGTIYGDRTEANTEEVFSEPINHYAICKLSCEKILLLYNQLYQMENVILRIANPYGKYQRISSGVGAVTAFTTEILKETKIVVWGDGENIRDFVDVSYVAQAFKLACQWNYDMSCVPIFNIGSGEKMSLNQLIQIIADELGKKADVEYLPQRNFDVKSNYLNIEKAKTILGYSLDKSAEECIRKYVRIRKAQD